MQKVKLGKEHISAVNRERRVVVNYEIATYGAVHKQFTSGEYTMEQLIPPYMRWLDEDGNQADSIWYCFGCGETAHYPSKYLPVWKQYQHWFDAGIDPCKVFIDETRKRGREVFYSYRIGNGTENTEDLMADMILNPMMIEHPDWVMELPVVPNDQRLQQEKLMWNFAAEGLREHKLNILKELAETYDIDGIEIDFARVPPLLPIGHQWEYRNHLTDLMREVRYAFLEIAEKRGRPLLLAARIPELIEGCHFDGIDIETWVKESLVDILTLGCRSLEADLAQFRHLIAGTHIKLYPVYDIHHESDSYPEFSFPMYDPIKVMRGVFTNYWQQGADGIQTFNFPQLTRKDADSIGFNYSILEGEPGPDALMKIYCEMGSLSSMLHKDKTFVVQRRAGGHPWFFGFPEDGIFQELMYHNSNMLSVLPAKLGIHGKNLTYIRMYIGDDVNENKHVKSINLRLLLSETCTDSTAGDEKIEAGLIRPRRRTPAELYTNPLRENTLTKMEIRLNNIVLPLDKVHMGWLVFSVDPEQLALGTNLVGVRLISDVSSQVSIEKMELDIDYKD